MKITNLKLFVVELPFRFSFNHNLAKRSSSQNLIVEATIQTESGISIGYGEGIPREYVTGEKITQAVTFLEKQYFPHFTNREFANATELISYIQNQFYFFGLDERASGASWCALEIALLDAVSQSQKIPLGQLLSGENYKPTFGVKYGATASLTNKKILAPLLIFFKIYGFTTVKLKLGKEIKDAIERVKLARKIMGARATLRVDSNCAWSVADTIQFSKAAEAYNIASIEQPLPADDIDGILKLASSIPQSIVLDESVCTIKQAKFFADNGIKVDFNIRVSKMGGLLASSTIKNIADQKGINSHLGAQVGESGILTIAGRILAISEGHFVNYEGSANSLLLKFDLTKENLTFEYGGHGKLPKNRSHFGLGITVDQKKLHRSIIHNFDTINRFSHFPFNSPESLQDNRLEETQLGSKR